MIIFIKKIKDLRYRSLIIVSLLFLMGIFLSCPRVMAEGTSSTSVNGTVLAKPVLSVTMISKNKAGLRWTAVSGASGYRIYQGKKLIKSLASSVTSCSYRGKGAGKSKYRVSAFVNGSSASPIEGPASNPVKGKENSKSFGGSKSYKSIPYGDAVYRIKKIKLDGKFYKITGYVLNHRYYKLLKYRKLSIGIYCNGKKLAFKNFKNLKVDCKRMHSKKLVLKIKGQAGIDFRNASGVKVTLYRDPYWEHTKEKEFPS